MVAIKNKTSSLQFAIMYILYAGFYQLLIDGGNFFVLKKNVISLSKWEKKSHHIWLLTLFEKKPWTVIWPWDASESFKFLLNSICSITILTISILHSSEVRGF